MRAELAVRDVLVATRTRCASLAKALVRRDGLRVPASDSRLVPTKRVYAALQRRVIVSIRRVAEESGMSIPTVTAALGRLEEMGIAREITGRSYGRLFAYDRQLEILNRTDDPGAGNTDNRRTREDVWRDGFERGV